MPENRQFSDFMDKPMVWPHGLNFRLITAKFYSVQKYRNIMVT